MVRNVSHKPARSNGRVESDSVNDSKRRAIVFGAGHAGQGHARALALAGVDVVGMASRTADVGAKVAAEAGVPRYSADWRALLAETKPDIVAVATPAGTHYEMIAAALEAGCHVMTDKPLATTAADAKALYEQAQAAGAKTAFSAGSWYQPQALLARHIVQSGVLGRVCEIEAVSHFNWPALMPFGWPHRLDMGGGRLNNMLPSLLAMTQSVLQQDVLASMGECRNDLKRAPIADVGSVQDVREFARQALKPAQAAKLKFAEADSDWSFTALVRVGGPARGLDEAVSATFRHSAIRLGRYSDYFALLGERGTLHIQGAFMQGPLFLKTDGPTWEELAIPLEILDSLPDEANPTQLNWNQLVREFVADIRGEKPPRYLTFRDGWIYQEVIETIRSGRSWTLVPR